MSREQASRRLTIKWFALFKMADSRMAAVGMAEQIFAYKDGSLFLGISSFQN